MRRVFLILLLAVCGLSAADFSGKWAGEQRKIKGGPDGPDVDVHYLVLAQKGNTVTGTAGPHDFAQFDIQNVKVEGSRLTFEISVPEAGMVVAYDLQLSGKTLTGSMKSKQGPEVEAKLRFNRE